MIEPVIYEGAVKTFVENYDGVTHSIWNVTAGPIVKVREAIRSHYLLQQNFRCAYCRMQKKEEHGLTWDVEHILPKSLFPQFLFEPKNLAIACKECNGPKDNVEMLGKALKSKKVYPANSFDFRLVHPHYDKFSEHFELTILRGRRSYRVLNVDKAKFTYIACNFFRFDYKFAEWDSYDEAVVAEFSEFLDNCPPDAPPSEIVRMLGHMRFEENVDF